MDRPVVTVLGKVGTHGFQKRNKRTAVHFAGGHGKLVVLGLAQAADVP